jgi:hypothetical protein
VSGSDGGQAILGPAVRGRIPLLAIESEARVANLQ